ncbi:uncharacterized protein LOC133424181 [Cololabis saira]|uniref:uncharacterized protein LOC133424181 n=1 Tax=Cololabis saira TaxID=129043 RepID=UPI002AD3FE03|nr:uncharacterized protein LOC133424181 [Cololabis saira]
MSRVAMHHSIITCDGKPAVERCTTCCRQFHCPLCPKGMFKPNQPARLQRHLEVHIKNAIAFQDNNACGPHCEIITKSENVRPCRSSWTFKLHPAQEQLLKYVLDTDNLAGELIVKTGKSCLTRADFWGLGLNKEMESTIGNACFEVIEKIAQSQGKTIFVADLYVSLIPGNWTEKTGLQIQGFPRQPYGIDCGIFMLMNAFYTTLDAPYDFSVTDMPLLRQWWCIILMENFYLGSHGKLFAHWTDASKALLRGEVPPVFRLRKRKVDDITEDEEQQAEVSVRPADKDTPVEGDSVEDRILHDCRDAAEWVEANKQLFSARVDLPDILCMGENQAEAALQYGRVWTEQLDDNEKDSILEPFKFTFYSTKDMWKFCDEIVDKRHSLAYCECHHR